MRRLRTGVSRPSQRILGSDEGEWEDEESEEGEEDAAPQLIPAAAEVQKLAKPKPITDEDGFTAGNKADDGGRRRASDVGHVAQRRRLVVPSSLVDPERAEGCYAYCRRCSGRSGGPVLKFRAVSRGM
jgi:hypothetical protein